MSDPIVAGLNARIQHLLTWLRIIADEAERSRRPRIALLAAMASAGEPPTRDPKEAGRRITACLQACAGLETRNLEKVARLDDRNRPEALAALARALFLHSKG